MKDLSTLSSDQLKAIVAMSQKELEAREKAEPSFPTHGDAAKRLIELCPDLVGEKVETIKTKLGALVGFGALKTSPRGDILVSSLEAFVAHGVNPMIIPSMLKSARQVERSKKADATIDINLRRQS